jgi:hypothetical protein
MASQLQVVDLGGQGATGHAADEVELANSGPAPCSVEGRPTVELRDGRGRLLARSDGRMPFMCGLCGQKIKPGPLLVPARSARADPEPDFGSGYRPGLPNFTLAQGECPGGVLPPGSTLFLALPDKGGRTPILHWGLPFDYRCDLDPQEYPPPGRPLLLAGPYAGVPVVDYVDNRRVTIDIVAPDTAVAGTTMEYRIRTHVAGEVDLGVVGCPTYTERLGDITERHRFNCEGIEDFPERQGLVDQWFTMVFSIPCHAPTGDQVLSWELDPPFHAVNTAHVRMRAG